jgi:SET domain-containing protein
LTPEQWADVDPHEKITIASRDIEADEEITCDYEVDFPDPKDTTHGFLDDIRHLKHQK